jgi:hypothetical protein
MNRPTNTALKIAGIALVLSGLGGALAGCGGSDSDSDGGSATDAASDSPKDATKDGFCEKFTGLSAAVAQATSGDTSAAIKGLKDWVGEIEDYGTPSEMSDDARDGFEILIASFKGVDDDASMEDLQKLGADASAADTKKVEAFSAWTSENCPPPTLPSDDAS